MDRVGSHCLPPKSSQEEHLTGLDPTRNKSNSTQSLPCLAPGCSLNNPLLQRGLTTVLGRLAK